jgi:hypothetical protein
MFVAHRHLNRRKRMYVAENRCNVLNSLAADGGTNLVLAQKSGALATYILLTAHRTSFLALSRSAV